MGVGRGWATLIPWLKRWKFSIVAPMIRRALALALILFVGIQAASAGVGSHQAKIAGGTLQSPPDGAVGFLDAKDQEHLEFKYKAGKNGQAGKFPEGSFAIPYAKMTRVTYGDTKHLRVGQTIALAALAGAGGLLLLLSKSHTHYLTIDYKDATGRDQMIGFEVGTDAIQPLIDAIETRTGLVVEYEAAPRAH